MTETTKKIDSRGPVIKSYIWLEHSYGAVLKYFGMQMFHRKDENTGLITVKPATKTFEKQMRDTFPEECFENEAVECFKCHKDFGIKEDPTLCPHCLTSL